MENLSDVILDKVSKIIDDKLSQVRDEFQYLATIPDKINENYTTFKDALTQNLPTTNTATNIKDIIKEERNEQLVQERERKLRVANIIIHGIHESNEQKAN